MPDTHTMTRCSCGHLSDAHNPANGVCMWRDCYCHRFDPDSEASCEEPHDA